MSEATSEMFTALAKFQGELTNAAKSKSGHGYKYADLAQCIETARQPLLDNGLSVVQFLGQSESGTTLTTMLTHASGQWMRDTFVMKEAVLQGGAGKNPAQAMGASITYMRRYAYAAIIGMAQEDEDAVNAKQAVSAIVSALKNNDIKWISENWNGIIASSWNALPANVVYALQNINSNGE